MGLLDCIIVATAVVTIIAGFAGIRVRYYYRIALVTAIKIIIAIIIVLINAIVIILKAHLIIISRPIIIKFIIAKAIAIIR